MARTLSTTAHQKVLRAATELVAEIGLEATSMDAVAKKSGVSKATIYKHWADKEALLLEMLADVNGLHDRPSFDTGDVKRDIIAVLSYRPSDPSRMRERIMPHFVAYSASNPSFGLAWRNLVMDPPRRELRYLLQLGIERGELSPTLDIDVCLAMLLGPILYWFIFLRRTTEDPKTLAEGIVNAFWAAFALPAEPRPSPIGRRRARYRAATLTEPQPLPTQPLPTQPLPTQPLPTQPLPTQPLPTQPLSSQPLSSQPLPTQPLPTQPLPTQPLPTQPLPTQPLPTQPLPTQPLPSRDRKGAVP